MTDPNKLTPTELHAVQSLLNAVKLGHDDDAKFWAARHEVMTAMAKMRAELKARQS
jgi:hypothetical protein